MTVNFSLSDTVPEKPGLRERQRQARGEAILQAAFALITEQGYEALTMETLAERVGITRQTLYHHFASKDEIVLRAILSMVDEGTRRIQETSENCPAIERLRGIARWMLELRFSPARAEFVKARLSLLPLKARPEYRRAFERRAEALTHIVETAQAEGDIQSNLPGGLVVQMLLGLVTDADYETLIVANTARPDQVIAAVLDVFFRGLRPVGIGNG